MAIAYLGIDWGTHSSKWCYQDTAGRRVLGPIWDSRVSNDAGQLAMHTVAERHTSASEERELKRKLIRDPDQPFWEGPRRRLGVTLGEAVVFSLIALLADAKARLQAQQVSLWDANGCASDLVIRFSHPNWVLPTSIPALQMFRDAAVLAMNLVPRALPSWRDGRVNISASTLTTLARAERTALQGLRSLPSTYSQEAFAEALNGSSPSGRWELVFESCAAAFPYLVDGEPELFADSPNLVEQRWIRKVLAVDVGAGSTDFGYFLRAIKRSIQRDLVAPVLIWFPPAPAVEIAGNGLTDRIRDHWAKEGRPLATSEEAEIYKTSGAVEWHERPFVSEWCAAISDAVGDYMQRVPDQVRLPKPPELELVLTGGSSAVPPLRNRIVGRVAQALQDRGIPEQLCMQTRIASGHDNLLGASSVERAQLAVSMGASHPRLTELIHYPTGLQ